jgi:glycerate 2-kinase
MPGKVSRGVDTGSLASRAPRAVRAAMTAAYRAAIAAVDPCAAAMRALAIDRGAARVSIRGMRRTVALPIRDGLLVVGAGKGAAGLAAGVERELGSIVVDGLVIVPPGYERRLARIAVAFGSHPVPDATSVAATRRLLRMLDRHPRASVLVLLTGGASSLLALPARGLTLADVRGAGRWLLASGIDIAAANAVRKHLSAISGGRLAERLIARRSAALVVSDVPGNDPAVIGSGPTVGDPTTFADALSSVRDVATARLLPPRVRRRLEDGARGRADETPKPGSPAARACPTMVVAGNGSACAGVAAWGRSAGFRSVVVRRRPFTGATNDVARQIVRALRVCGARARGRLPTLWIGGGETTVRLPGDAGKGGRNQSLAAAVACELAGVAGWALLAAGTDGIDGPTDAAGGFADGSSARRALRTGRTLAEALDRHDVYPTLGALGDLFRPGPTGTNVADVVIALVWKDRGWRLPRRVIQASSRR